MRNKEELQYLCSDPWLDSCLMAKSKDAQIMGCGAWTRVSTRPDFDELFRSITLLQQKKWNMYVQQQKMDEVHRIRGSITYLDPAFLSTLGFDYHIMMLRVHAFESEESHRGWRSSEVVILLNADGQQIRYPEYFDITQYTIAEWLFQKVVPFLNRRREVRNAGLNATSWTTASQNPLDIIQLDNCTLSNMVKFFVREEQRLRQLYLQSNDRAHELDDFPAEIFPPPGLFWGHDFLEGELMPNPLKSKKIVRKDRRINEFKDKWGFLHRSIMMTTGQDGVATTSVTSSEGELKEVQVMVITGGEIQMEGTVIGNTKGELQLCTKEMYGDKKPAAYGYKVGKTGAGECCLIKLLIPEDARVALEFGEDKMRADKVQVLSIWTYEYVGNYWEDVESNAEGNIKYLEPVRCAYSCVYDQKQIQYNVNEVCLDPNFDPNMERVCVPGIHFCWLRATALEYHGMYNLVESELPDEPSQDSTATTTSTSTN